MSRALAVSWSVFASGICVATAAQDPPAIVRLEPADRATDVDARATPQLTVRFDRAMDTGRAVSLGAGPGLPTLADLEWRDERTLVVHTQLAPGRLYTLTLAGQESTGLADADGNALPTTPWRFVTAGAPLAPQHAEVAATRLFAAVRDHYAHRDLLGVDWARMERDHLPALRDCGSGGAFALALADLLAAAQDVHVTVTWRDSPVETWRRDGAANFDARGLRHHFPRLAEVARIGLAGRTEDDVGYLHVGSFARQSRRDFDRLLQALRGMRDCKALVLDVRTNVGGDELLARRLAAFFVTGERVYALQRLRDPSTADGFLEPEERRITGNSPPDVFTGRVAVLMGPRNIATCESFLLMMMQAPRAFLVGEGSYGSAGNPVAHELLPGLVVSLPHAQLLRPNGAGIEGTGIAPHMRIRATPEQLAERDPVLEEAMLRLRSAR